MRYSDELMADMRKHCIAPKAGWNNTTLTKVANGDEIARQEIIRNNMVFVIYQVDTYIKSLPNITYLRDDLTSAGFLGVCKAIANVVRGADVIHVASYLNYWIRREILLILREESPHLTPDEEGPCIANADMEQISKDDANYSLVDLRDMIYACCETETDRTLVGLRESQGLNCTEIAQHLNMPKRTAYYKLRGIEERFDRRCNSAN